VPFVKSLYIFESIDDSFLVSSPGWKAPLERGCGVRMSRTGQRSAYQYIGEGASPALFPLFVHDNAEIAHARLAKNPL
jgi:hypothetical protein